MFVCLLFGLSLLCSLGGFFFSKEFFSFFFFFFVALLEFFFFFEIFQLEFLDETLGLEVDLGGGGG